MSSPVFSRGPGAENSATATITATAAQARGLPSLVARYQHASDRAAPDSLHAVAYTTLTPARADQQLTDPGAPQLAHVLAQAAEQGANPARVLRAAVDHDEHVNVRSAALVLAARIRDYPTFFSIPREEPTGRPLPWLCGPRVRHPEWDRYLRHRAPAHRRPCKRARRPHRGLSRAVPTYPPTSRQPRRHPRRRHAATRCLPRCTTCG